MQQGNTVFDLKGQARRLRTALAELQMPVTHVVALNLVARAHGERNWEVLEAALSAANQVADNKAQSNEQWLHWLDAALRMRDVTEVDLDDMVHDCLAPEEASQVNNNGLYAQLEALLAWHTEPHVSNPRRELVRHLEDVIEDLELPMPESGKGNERFGFAVPAHISVCSGSALERSMRVDALEWFANHPSETVSRLVVDGLCNSSMSDEVALWLEEHSLDSTMRQQLQEMLQYMRTVIKADKRPTSDIVGVTVSIDETAVAAFMDAQMQSGVEFSDEALEELGMSR